MRRKLNLLLFGVSLFTPVVHGQSVFTIHLDNIKTAPTTGNFAIIAPIRCDSDGNLFFREMESSGFEVPLVRLANDAQNSIAFDTSKASDEKLRKAKVTNFAVQTDGSVFQMLRDDQSNVYFAHFRQDGSFDSSFTLNMNFEPTDFSVLSKGSLVVSGLQNGTDGERPFLALFDPAGRFVKVINTGEESNTRQNIYLSALDSFGDYVYLLRPGKPSLAILISPAGEVEKRFPLNDPPGMHPVAIRGGPGRFLVEFAQPTRDKKDKSLFVVYDNFDGSKLAEYEPASDLGGAFGCYDWKNNFEFLSLNEQMHRQILSGSIH